MAAAEVLAFTESSFANGYGCPGNRISETGWDERSLRAQLGLIAKAWLVDRHNVQVRARVRLSFVPAVANLMDWPQRCSIGAARGRATAADSESSSHGTKQTLAPN